MIFKVGAFLKPSYFGFNDYNLQYGLKQRNLEIKPVVKRIMQTLCLRFEEGILHQVVTCCLDQQSHERVSNIFV